MSQSALDAASAAARNVVDTMTMMADIPADAPFDRFDDLPWNLFVFLASDKRIAPNSFGFWVNSFACALSGKSLLQEVDKHASEARQKYFDRRDAKGPDYTKYIFDAFQYKEEFAVGSFVAFNRVEALREMKSSFLQLLSELDAALKALNDLSAAPVNEMYVERCRLAGQQVCAAVRRSSGNAVSQHLPSCAMKQVRPSTPCRRNAITATSWSHPTWQRKVIQS